MSATHARAASCAKAFDPNNNKAKLQIGSRHRNFTPQENRNFLQHAAYART
jgi:hypothetical protein